MYKIEFFFKINIHKNKKKKLLENIGPMMLLTYLYKDSKVKLTKIFTNKYLMIKSPFHYKVSKKILYNKQGIVKMKVFLKKKPNVFFFEKFNNIKKLNTNIFKISCVYKQ